MSFRHDFIWGAAAASYQVEGAAHEDGRGLSVWDMFCRQPDKVVNGDTGDVACDHYHRWKEDVALMKQLGLRAYRLSVAWPRVLPDGTGAVNEAGMAFYERLVDELLANGIVPWITLFHWDYPYRLFLRGGWLNPDSPRWFADYSALVVKRLSDRVEHWMTLNEPQCFIGLGHDTGTHAPGLKLGQAETLLAGHHTLLGHGLSVQAIRANARKPPTIGVAAVGNIHLPAGDREADVQAARRATFEIKSKGVFNNTWWADPMVLGHYPEDGLQLFGTNAPKFTAAEMALIRQPLDFYGVNIYNGWPTKAGEDGAPVSVPFPAGQPQTHFAWNVTPDVLYWGAKFLHERYQRPIIITENGMSANDWVCADGKVHDAQRIDFLRGYLRGLRRAVAEGVDIRGYFHWSIMDNFEWHEGYKHRFGLVHVDYGTQRRTPKDSALWYREVIASNGGHLDVV